MQTVLKVNLLLFQLEINITRIVKELHFVAKFNMFCLPIAIAAFCAASYVWLQLSANAEQEVTDKARVMLETARALRTYTTTEIAPLLGRQQAQIEHGSESVRQILDIRLPAAMQKALLQLPTAHEQQALQAASQRLVEAARQERPEAPERRFLPEAIPFYAATEAFNFFRQQYPDYAYKEAALNPTNPRDRTSDWEADLVEMFRNNASRTEFVGRRETPGGSALYISTPIRVDDGSCLTCHGAAESAPPELVKQYGAANGFGWRLNDVIGTQIVSVPAQLAENRAAAAQRTIMIWLAGVFAGLLLLINIVAFMFFKSGALTTPPAPLTSVNP
ncbi:Tll0287-like domain-containing protein [Methylocella sp.]|jgi:hypothetical protein|uniref:Tll0287-like domain-containing protein n=1 Tax=Methylocella sp. TaxID=1978226 RepID=UPI003C1A89B0